jgi:hypothetical protein
MAMLPPDCAVNRAVAKSEASKHLAKVRRLLSAVTMVMTAPQVLTIWIGENATGISLLSWALLFYGLHVVYIRGSETETTACAGWIFLDAAVVAGVIMHA